MSSKNLEETFNVDSVAVIGAGPCGLAAAKYLIAEKKFSNVQIFEQRDTVGGLWTYSPLNVIDNDFTVPRTSPAARPDTAIHVDGRDAAQFVSPIYDFLETNIPHSLMGYSDQRFPEGTSLFPPHAVVKKYLEAYADELKPLVSLSSQVLGIQKFGDGDRKSWEIEALDLKAKTTRTSRFDAVLVASGHYNDPFIPDIPGLAEFDKTYPGSISHSKFYKNPAQYKDKKIVVVGNSASGIDISTQISTVSKQPIIVSEKSVPNTPSEAQPWVKVVPEIVEFQTANRAVRFSNGDVETGIDAVIFCTGYFYSYPFLKGLSPPVVTDGSHAQDLYEHVIYIDDPTLAFLGVPQRVVPFPIAEAQAAWVSRAWAGRLRLPPVSEMRDWERRTVEENGRGTALHNLAFPQDVEYINKLHGWSTSAKSVPGLENDGAGKFAPYWDEEAAWVRERFPSIKLASRKLGEKKHEVKSLGDLGFDYKTWKAAQSAE